MMAPDKSLATLPISIMVCGIWAGTLPLGFLAKRFGRRTAYASGAAAGTVAGLIGYAAILQANFWLYLVATFCGGLYAASHMSYRFGAADTASAEFKPKAVSWVMAGGLFAAILGPQLVIFTKDLMPPHLFAWSYIGQAAFALIAGIIILMFFRAPGLAHFASTRPGRPLARDRAPAEIHRRGGVRGRELRADEPDDDLGAARDVRLRPFGRRRDARHPVARAGDVCAELLHRLADPALRRAARDRGRACSAGALGGGRPLRASRSRISGSR